MKWHRYRTGGRLRSVAVAAVMAIASSASIPAAQASYSGTFTPTQTVKPHVLVTPTSFACTAPGSNSVSLTWVDADGTTANPYSGTNWATGYIVERQQNGGSFASIGTPTSAAFTDTFGLLTLHVNDTLTYRVRATKSTLWQSANSTTVTATVTSFLVFFHVTCP